VTSAYVQGLAAVLLIGLITGCTVGGRGKGSAEHGPSAAIASSSPIPTPTPPTLVFCAGVFPPLKIKAGDKVTVRIETGSGKVFTPSVKVGTQLTLEVPAGPYKIIVKGQTQVSGTITAGQIGGASVGDGCPG